MSLGQWSVIGCCTFLVIWYFGANLYNRQLGIKTYRWLRQGLRVLGAIDQAGWLGSSSSGARMLIRRPKKPFRAIESSFLLETREIIPWWMYKRWIGQREQMTLRATLRKAPHQTVMVFKEGDRLKSIQKLDQSFERVDAPPGFSIFVSGQPDELLLEALYKFLKGVGSPIHSIILQPQPPQLALTASIKPLLRTSPEAFFQGVASLWSYYID